MKNSNIITKGVVGAVGKVYEVRGEKVMLDFDLAEIYGYTVSGFNQQVKRNIDRFDEDFRFQLTENELKNLKSQNVISSNRGENNLKSQNVISSWGGGRYLPYAFTEQGIYMLMTVLRGELAIKQSKALIRMFHAMKTYITENQNLQAVIISAIKNIENVEQIKEQVSDINKKISDIDAELENTLKKSDISPVLLNFGEMGQKELVLLNGELMKATETYMNLYSEAKKSIFIIDDYVGIKTLRYLGEVKPNIEINIFSDNVSHHLTVSDYADFKKEFGEKRIRFIKSRGFVHDRFIVIDCGEKSEKMYHCGASSKDAGGKLTMINLMEGEFAKKILRNLIEKMKEHEELELR